MPVRPRGVVLDRHTAVVTDGQITDVLPWSEAESRYPGAEIIRLDRHVLMPGLANMHTHSPMTLLRGYADDMNLEEWLTGHIWPAEAQNVSHEFVTVGTELAMAEMIRGGTTLFNDNYFYPDAMAAAAERCGMRAFIGVPMIDNPTSWAQSADEYFEKGLAVADQWRDSDRIHVTFAPHSPYTCSDDMLGRIADIAEQREMRVHMHVLETRWDIVHSLQHFQLRPLQRLRNLELLNDRFIAVHMTQLTEGDIALLRERGVHVIHCPQSNLKLASGLCPVADLLAGGVNVAIGTDGAASNNDLDMISEAQTAALLCKGVSGNPAAGTAVEILDMLTINAARALGLENRLGTLERGRRADLCAIDLSFPETQPLYNVHSQIVYAASRQQVTDVWVEGRALMRERQLTTIDIDDVLDRAGHWANRIVAGRMPEKEAAR